MCDREKGPTGQKSSESDLEPWCPISIFDNYVTWYLRSLPLFAGRKLGVRVLFYFILFFHFLGIRNPIVLLL